MNTSYAPLKLTLAVLLAVLLASTLGFGSECKERRLERGNLEVGPDSTTHTCWCGIFIQTHHRTCDTQRIYTPDRYLCDGPASEVIDCGPGGFVHMEERTEECGLVLAAFGLKVGQAGFSLTLPICVGTECRVVASRVTGSLLTSQEWPCSPEERGSSETP